VAVEVRATPLANKIIEEPAGRVAPMTSSKPTSRQGDARRWHTGSAAACSTIYAWPCEVPELAHTI
jgi:hypothetical protein